MKNRRIGPDEVEEKFGVSPDRVIDVQALAGDSVDNIPGAPGIGIKTAAQLIGEYGDLDTLLARAEEIRQPKRRQTLIEHADQIRVSRDLVTLRDDVPLDRPLEALEVTEPDPDALLGFLGKMEFRTLTGRIAAKLGVEAPVPAPGGGSAGASSPAEAGADAAARDGGASGPAVPEQPPVDASGYEVVRDLAALEAWVARIRDRGVVAVDTETTGLDEMVAGLVGISLATEAGRACYMPINHVGGAGDLFTSAARLEGQLDEATVLGRPAPGAGGSGDPQDRPEHEIRRQDLRAARRGGGADRRHDADLVRAAFRAARARHGHAQRDLSRACADPDQAAPGLGQGGAHLRCGADRGGGALRGGGCGHHLPALGGAEAADAVRAR